MKSPVASIVALVLLLSPSLSRGDAFSEFRIPAHDWRSGFLDAEASGDWNSRDYSGNDERSASFSGHAGPRLSLAHDSDPLFWSLSGSVIGALSVAGGQEKLRFTDRDIQGASHAQQTFEQLTLNAAVRAYPWAAPLGVSLSGAGSLQASQGWNRGFQREIDDAQPNARFENSARIDLQNVETDARVSVALGWGRVRDATVVQDVHVLEDRLLATGGITRPLSARAREKLAALESIGPSDYAAAHERPLRYFWRDVERILGEDGALGENCFDPYSLMRAEESYVFRVQRLRGWFLGPVFQGRTEHDVRRRGLNLAEYVFADGALTGASISSDFLRSAGWFDEADLGGTAEVHLPLGWRWQIDAQSQVTVPPRRGENGIHAASAASANWAIADRWLATAALSHTRDSFTPREGTLVDDEWQARGVLQLGWYVEDHVQLSARLTHTQWRYIRWDSEREFDRETTLYVGVTCRLAGALDAPGLIEPVRPMR